jgi:hypothetical protein
VLAKHAPIAHAALEDVRPDLICGRLPALLQMGVAANVGEFRRTIESDPTHQLRRDVVLRVAARLPDALVRFLPQANRALRLGLHDRPEAARQSLAAPRMEQHRVEHGAEHVILTLVEGAVPDRTGGAPAYADSSSRIDSVKWRRPSMPYMTCSAPSADGSRSATNCMNSSASQSRFSQCSARSVNVESRIHGRTGSP